jgi:hypothetical protein
MRFSVRNCFWGPPFFPVSQGPSHAKTPTTFKDEEKERRRDEKKTCMVRNRSARRVLSGARSRPAQPQPNKRNDPRTDFHFLFYCVSKTNKSSSFSRGPASDTTGPRRPGSSGACPRGKRAHYSRRGRGMASVCVCMVGASSTSSPATVSSEREVSSPSTGSTCSACSRVVSSASAAARSAGSPGGGPQKAPFSRQ